MPTSTFMHIPALAYFLGQVMPTSILDVGLGNGKLGFIARDLLDVMKGERYRKEEWQIRIDGIEVFDDYIQDHQRAIYNDIYIGDAFEVIDTLGSYDLIILGDVLEHFEKDRALQFLAKCFAHANENLILCIPLGEGWTQPEVYGNSYEEHLSFWTADDFKPMARERSFFHFPNRGDYGCFLLNKSKSECLHHPVREQAEGLAAAGRHHEAITLMEGVLSSLPANLKTEYVLADLLLKAGRLEQAVERLKGMHQRFPEDESVSKYIDTIKGVIAQEAHQAYEPIS